MQRLKSKRTCLEPSQDRNVTTTTTIIMIIIMVVVIIIINCQRMRGGGRRLASAEETLHTEIHGLSDYNKDTEKEYNRLLQSMGKHKTKREYKEDTKKQKKDWMKKPLYGQHSCFVAGTEKEKTYAWIKNEYMKKTEDMLLMAA